MFSLQLTDLKEAQSHNGLSPGYKSNLVIKWQKIWHLHGIPSGLYEAKLKSMDFDMYLMQTLLIWLILVESAIKNGISSNNQDVWQKTHLCWNLQCDPFLHYPSCLSLVENTHFCSIPILLALQTAIYLEIQLTNSNWVEPLSLAQLCPSLFSNLHVKLESFTKFS